MCNEIKINFHMGGFMESVDGHLKYVDGIMRLKSLDLTPTRQQKSRLRPMLMVSGQRRFAQIQPGLVQANHPQSRPSQVNPPQPIPSQMNPAQLRPPQPRPTQRRPSQANKQPRTEANCSQTVVTSQASTSAQGTQPAFNAFPSQSSRTSLANGISSTITQTSSSQN